MPHQKGAPELEQPHEPGQGDIAEQAQNAGENRNDDLADTAAGKAQRPGPGDGPGPRAEPSRMPGADSWPD